jgi:hypothetical protein
MNKEFLQAFAKTIGTDLITADAQWAGYTRQLGDAEREEIEDEGEESGKIQGVLYLCTYPLDSGEEI